MNSVHTVHRGCVFCSCAEIALNASKRYARKIHKNVPSDKSYEKMNFGVEQKLQGGGD